MKSSPLQLNNYFLTSLTFTANKDFDASKPVNVQFSDLQAFPTFSAQGEGARRWQVNLLVKHQAPRQEANTPYYFTLEMVGFFSVANDYASDKVEWLVKTNATSVLFSTAREIIRGLTASAPFGAMMLPTASFYDLKSLPPSPAPSVEQLSSKS